MEMETLKYEMTHKAEPLSRGSANNGHKAKPVFGLALRFLAASPRVSFIGLPAVNRFSIGTQRDGNYFSPNELCGPSSVFSGRNTWLLN